jgi:hypothetical protein
MFPQRDGHANQSSQNVISFLKQDHQRDQRRRDPSFNAMALDLASDLGDNRHAPNYNTLSGLPASFTTQLEMAARDRARERDRQGSEEESNRMSRIMLARMTTLEGLRKGSEDGGPSRDGSKGGGSLLNEVVKRKGKAKKRGSKKEEEEEDEERMGSSL